MFGMTNKMLQPSIIGQQHQTFTITIETTGGMKIEISVAGIEINDGQGGSIKLAGPKVSTNDGALEVT